MMKQLVRQGRARVSPGNLIGPAQASETESTPKLGMAILGMAIKEIGYLIVKGMDLSTTPSWVVTSTFHCPAMSGVMVLLL